MPRKPGEENDESFFKRASQIAPRVDQIADQLQLDLETSKRLQQYLIIHNAKLMERAEQANQDAEQADQYAQQAHRDAELADQMVKDFADLVNAYATRISNGEVNIGLVDIFADAQSGLLSLVGGLIHMTGEHEPTMLHVLKTMNKRKVEKVARDNLAPGEIAEWIHVFLNAAENM